MNRVLVIGGGRQLGKSISEHSDLKKFDITILNRGITSWLGHDFYKKNNVKYIKSERVDYISNNDISFDVVIDCCSYDPVQYEKESTSWKNFSGKYIFISSSYVYEYDSKFIYEHSKLINKAERRLDFSDRTFKYAIGKIECEKIASANLPDLLIFRPGILLSEEDHTGRIDGWINRIQTNFSQNTDQMKWKTQLLSVDDFVDFIYSCINKDASGIFNAAGSPISLDKFVNVVNQFSNYCENSIKKFCSNNIEFFEKESDSIINSDKAVKLGLNRTNSEKLLSHILQIKCKK
jgi:2'-hydroxyisoflavone reductase